MNNNIIVTQNGSDVRTATTSQILLSDKYPFHKLDKTNPVSFQNISILFNTDPPNPPGAGGSPSDYTLTTTVYTFPHGYNYIPATWVLFVNAYNYIAQPDLYNSGQGIILLLTDSGANGAFLSVTSDDTNIYVNVIKNYDTSELVSGPPIILGITLVIRIYVFVEDLSGS